MARPVQIAAPAKLFSAFNVTGHRVGVMRNRLRLGGSNGAKAMSPKRYFIVGHDDEWKIKFADEEFGPYRSQSEAMMFAVDAARKLMKRGAAAEVCLLGENGNFSAEWSGDQQRPTA
jgi:hypothetical protein